MPHNSEQQVKALICDAGCVCFAGDFSARCVVELS
jgi:hypothetical protein